MQPDPLRIPFVLGVLILILTGIIASACAQMSDGRASEESLKATLVAMVDAHLNKAATGGMSAALARSTEHVSPGAKIADATDIREASAILLASTPDRLSEIITVILGNLRLPFAQFQTVIEQERQNR